MYNAMIYVETVFGMDYLHWSTQTIRRIDFKLKGSYGSAIDVHTNQLHLMSYLC